MSSKKPSARAKRVNEFKSQLGGTDDVFAREDRRNDKTSQRKEAALRKKACTSKNRYRSYGEAQVAIEKCAEHGTTGLHAYRCPYCNGWHLTSHPEV